MTTSVFGQYWYIGQLVGTLGMLQREIHYIPHAKRDEPPKNWQILLLRRVINFFTSWKINVIYLIFYNVLAQYFVEDIFFYLVCYMTCYTFCKFAKAIGRSRNFAISKIGLFVTMVQGFQSLTVVINSSSILEF